MGKIIISENVSLDGVVQDPMGDEGFKRGGWFLETSDKDREEWFKIETDEAMATQALLLGRRSDEWFAARWESRTGAWADRLNGMPKFVVSSTIEEPRWRNSTVLSGDVVAAVARLKQQIDGDIVVYASTLLAHTLLEHDLVDELRLTVYPVVLGAGERLFGETTDKKPLRLVDVRTLGDNLTFVTYEVVRLADRGTALRAAALADSCPERRPADRLPGIRPRGDIVQASGRPRPGGRAVPATLQIINARLLEPATGQLTPAAWIEISGDRISAAGTGAPPEPSGGAGHRCGDGDGTARSDRCPRAPDRHQPRFSGHDVLDAGIRDRQRAGRRRADAAARLHDRPRRRRRRSRHGPSH